MIFMSMDTTKTEIVEGLRDILKKSLPHCDDGNPNKVLSKRGIEYEDDFVAINKIAHECLLKIQRLGVQELV